MEMANSQETVLAAHGQGSTGRYTPNKDGFIETLVEGDDGLRLIREENGKTVKVTILDDSLASAWIYAVGHKDYDYNTEWGLWNDAREWLEVTAAGYERFPQLTQSLCPPLVGVDYPVPEPEPEPDEDYYVDSRYEIPRYEISRYETLRYQYPYYSESFMEYLGDYIISGAVEYCDGSNKNAPDRRVSRRNAEVWVKELLARADKEDITVELTDAGKTIEWLRDAFESYDKAKSAGCKAKSDVNVDR